MPILRPLDFYQNLEDSRLHKAASKRTVQSVGVQSLTDFDKRHAERDANAKRLYPAAAAA